MRRDERDLMAFEKLDELIDLFAAGHEHAAASIWKELDAEFRVRVLKFLLYIKENWSLLDSTPDAVFQTRYGKWKVSGPRFETLFLAISKLTAASGNDRV
jgi:hypothetical protein